MSDDSRQFPCPGTAAPLDVFPQRGLKELLAEYERSLILTALEASRGHQRRAAAALGVLPSTLCEKMRRLGIRQGGEAGPDPS